MEVVIASSSVDAGISCWDLQTGSENLRYKSCASSSHGLATLGGNFLACSQLLDNSSSGSILYWSWHKPQVDVRSFPEEPIGPMVCNPEGFYLFGGGSSGNLYMWEVSSGRLLKKWRAHYQSVTCLLFSEDGSLLVSASHDGGIKVWCLMMLFDDMAGGVERKKTQQYSFSEHTLSITDLVSGSGLCNSIFISSSEDNTCKIWSLSRGELLRSITFPCGINAVAIDPGEDVFYAGGKDGNIYIVALIAEFNSNENYESHIIQVLSEQSECINCLAFSTDGVTLVSGSKDGTIRAWNTISQNVIHAFKHSKGSVNNVLIVKQPLTSSLQSQQDESNWQILACKKHVKIPLPPPLEKYTGMTDSQYKVVRQPSLEDQQDTEYYSYLVMKNQIEELQRQGSSGSNEMELERLKQESQKYSEIGGRYKKLYQDLHKVCVDDLMFFK